jgi:hypothetical protein
MADPKEIGTMTCGECGATFVLTEADNRSEYEERLSAHVLAHHQLMRATRSEAEGR